MWITQLTEAWQSYYRSRDPWLPSGFVLRADTGNRRFVEDTLDADTPTRRASSQFVTHRRAIVGTLLIALVIVEVPKRVILFLGWQSGALPAEIICRQLFMLFIPFIFARITPHSAGFDRQWMPSARSQWLWFPGLVLLLLAVAGLHAWLLSFRDDWWLISARWQAMADIAPVNVILLGVMFVLSAPIAEEIFWRAYCLPQLMKCTMWPIALSIHSVLFSLSHLPAHWSALVVTFFYGMVLGVWRLRFRSLVPLILGHMILNIVAVGPHYVAQYRSAVESYSKCRQIDVLALQSGESSVPTLIGFMSDPNVVVSSHAIEILSKNFRGEAEPYLAQTLVEADDETTEGALRAIEYLRYAGLVPQVRSVVWSTRDVGLQISAVLTLRSIGDEEGLSDIMQRHPDQRVRHVADEMIQLSARLKE